MHAMFILSRIEMQILLQSYKNKSHALYTYAFCNEKAKIYKITFLLLIGRILCIILIQYVHTFKHVVKIKYIIYIKMFNNTIVA